MKYPVLFSLLSLSISLPAQPTKLNEFISLAQKTSIAAKLAETQKEISINNYQVFISDLKPQVSFYGNIPAYSKDFFDVRQPDGSIKFLPRKQNFSNLGFAISQQILKTGGTFSLRTDFARFDDFSFKTRSFNTTPIYLRLDQPILGFNALKWNKKIEPIKLQAATKQELFDKQKIAVTICNLFFDVLKAQTLQSTSEENLAGISDLLAIENSRIPLGTTTEEKILQLRLQEIKAVQQAETSKYDVQISLLKLNTSAGLKNGLSRLDIPDQIPSLEITLDSAIAYARKNRPDYLNFVVSNLEAERAVKQALSAKREMHLTASFGVNNASNSFSNLYDNLLDQQRLSLGINFPIVDWGRRDARLNASISIQKLTQYKNELDEQNIVQEITTLVNTLNLLKSNIGIAKETESIARARYDISYTQYKNSKVSLFELNIARQELNQAKQEWLDALYQYWQAYFLFKQLTLNES